MIKKLTKEQESLIPYHIKKWVGQASVPMDEDKALELINKMYARMGEEKPIVIFGNSPLNTILLAALYFSLFKDKKNISSQLKSQLDSQLNSKLKSQLDSQLNSQLESQLCSQLGSQLGSQLFSQIDSQLGSQLGSQIRSQLGSQLFSQIDSQLGSQLFSQIDSQLGSQLGSQIRSQLGSQIRSQIRSQLNSQLHSQLHSQLRSQLHSQIDSQIYSELESQLHSQLRSQLRSQIYSELESQLHSQLHSQLRSQLHSQIDSQIYSQLTWYLSIWWLVWCGWYEYGKMIGVKFDEDKYELFINFNSHINFIIPYKRICFVSHKPTEIHWKENKLHNEKGAAVLYKDGYSFYSLNGIKVPEWLVMTDSGKIDPQLALTEKNVDVQREIIRKVGAERMLKACNAKTLDIFVDTHTKGGNEYKLMQMKIGNIDRKYLYFEHASFPGVFYAQPVHPDLKTALHARAWILGIGEVKELEIKSDQEIKECLPLEVA